MAAKNKTEIAELKEFMRDRFSEIAVGQAEIKGEINTLHSEIKAVDEKLSAKIDGLDKRLSNVETSVQKIPELAEKVGEFKWWKQAILILSSGAVGGLLTRFFGNQNP